MNLIMGEKGHIITPRANITIPSLPKLSLVVSLVFGAKRAQAAVLSGKTCAISETTMARRAILHHELV